MNMDGGTVAYLGGRSEYDADVKDALVEGSLFGWVDLFRRLMGDFFWNTTLQRS